MIGILWFIQLRDVHWSWPTVERSIRASDKRHLVLCYVLHVLCVGSNSFEVSLQAAYLQDNVLLMIEGERTKSKQRKKEEIGISFTNICTRANFSNFCRHWILTRRRQINISLNSRIIQWNRIDRFNKINSRSNEDFLQYLFISNHVLLTTETDHTVCTILFHPRRMFLATRSNAKIVGILVGRRPARRNISSNVKLNILRKPCLYYRRQRIVGTL